MTNSYEVVLGDDPSYRGESDDDVSTRRLSNTSSDILNSISDFQSKHEKRRRRHSSSENATGDDIEAQLEPKFRNYGSNTHSFSSRVKSVGACKCAVIAVLAILMLTLFGIVVGKPDRIEPFSSNSQPTTSLSPTYWKGKKLPNLDEMRAGKYSAKRQSINWIEGVPGTEETGDFITKKDSQYVASSWKYRNDESHTLKITPEYTRIAGLSRSINEVQLNVNHTKALVRTDSEKNWRHSSFSLFWILDIESHEFEPVYPARQDARFALARWSPDGEKIAFVLDNNVYLRDVASREVTQITFDGGEHLFYGRPDWVYEEEVFSGASALWWSLNGKYLGFLKTNDTLVPEFPIPYFAKHGDDGVSEGAYPDLVKIKYPKPGFANPKVSMMFLKVGDESAYEVDFDDDEEKLITEVVWSDKDEVLVRMTNRESDTLKIGLLNAEKRTARIVRESNTSSDGGWFEVTQDTMFVPADKSNGRMEDGYIDTIVVDGFNHLAYFSPMDASEPKVVLTRGKWEVDAAPLAVNLETNLVFFMATERSPVERHLYFVNLDGTGMTPLTYDPTEKAKIDATFSASISKDARYALLTYEGPDVPRQEVLSLPKKAGDVLRSDIIEQNKALKAVLNEYALPLVTYSQVVVDEDEDGPIYANAVEIKPASFNPKKKYPVLFFVYGGPISQTVSKRYSIDFQKIMASTLDAIVVTVDGRGTGFMGRKFRAVVRDNLGDYEVRDQITAAKQWSQRAYVDPSKIAIWGWSYGGYMTLKTLETDGGETFRYGMAVAPVTNWRFYDSIYTERYMHTPEHNKDGYEKARIKDVKRLGQNTRFLIMHGTGDDNVHLQNTLVLLDILDENKIENYDMHVFPDSDHSIYFHNANTVVYDKLHQWIANAFAGRYVSQ